MDFQMLVGFFFFFIPYSKSEIQILKKSSSLPLILRQYTTSSITLLMTGEICLLSHNCEMAGTGQCDPAVSTPIHIKILQFALIIVFTPRNRYELSVFYLVYNVNCWWNDHKIKLVTAKLQMERFSRVLSSLQNLICKYDPGKLNLE